jgi:hypothetical protein
MIFILVRGGKEWLLVASILLHVACIMFSLGGFIIINVIIATKPCVPGNRVCYVVHHPLNTSMVIIMIILGGISMVTFSLYLIKLIKVFNNIQNK